MSDWYDIDGNPLGRWEPCDEATYVAAIADPGDEATVFASRTHCGQRLPDAEDGTARYGDQHIYTEWGRRGHDAPVTACDDRWDYFGERLHSHYVFVRFTVSDGAVA